MDHLNSLYLQTFEAWCFHNQGALAAVLTFMIMTLIPNVMVAKKQKPVPGQTRFWRFWAVLGQAAFLSFENAKGSIKWPFAKQGPEVVEVPDHKFEHGFEHTTTELKEAIDADAHTIPIIPRHMPTPADAVKESLTLSKLSTLIVLLVAMGCAGTNASTSPVQVLGVTAKSLGVIVNQVDATFSAQYKIFSEGVIKSPNFQTLRDTQSSEAAMTYYQEKMKPWDRGIDGIKIARASVMAIGTAIQATSQPDRIPAIVQSFAYCVGSVIGIVQISHDLGVPINQAALTSLSRACVFTTALGKGAGLPDVTPAACKQLGDGHVH